MLEKQAAGFLGSCLPSSAMLGSSIGLKGAGGAAMHRLAAQGLGWAPTLGNLCTLLCFVLALALNAQLNEVGGTAWWLNLLSMCVCTIGRYATSGALRSEGPSAEAVSSMMVTGCVGYAGS